MGTKRVANLFDKWLGTNTQIVLELAECPVWVIPQNAPLNYPKILCIPLILRDITFW